MPLLLRKPQHDAANLTPASQFIEISSSLCLGWFISLFYFYIPDEGKTITSCFVWKMNEMRLASHSFGTLTDSTTIEFSLQTALAPALKILVPKLITWQW